MDNEKNDLLIGRYVIVFYLISMINATIKSIFPISREFYPVISGLFAIFLVLLLIYSLPIIFRRSGMLFITIEAILLIVFSASELMGYAYESVLLTNAVWAMGVGAPIAVCVYSIENIEGFYKQFLRASYFMTAILSLTIFFPCYDYDYNMSFSYFLLIPTLFHINQMFKRFNLIRFLVIVYELCLILFYGSRGPILCLLVMLVLKFTLNYNKTAQKIIILGILCSSMILLMSNIGIVGELLIKFAHNFGFETRSLQLLFNGYFLESSGRSYLMEYYWYYVKHASITGYGALGMWIALGSGPHNMIIELFLAFGVPLGIILVVLLLFIQIKSLINFTGAKRELLIIYISLTIVLYFFAGDTFLNYNLFFLIGICLNNKIYLKN